MKPIHLNLAARPYRDYRPVYAAVVVLSLLTAFLMLNNIETYYRYIHETRTTRAKIEQIEEQVKLETERQEVARERLKNFDLVRLDQQTRFINSKFLERAFSWSALLDELESILADDVRLVSVSPSFREDGTIALSMEFQTKSADGMITTINRMNADPHFGEVFPSSESQDDLGAFQFQLTALYRPDARETTIRPAKGIR